MSMNIMYLNICDKCTLFYPQSSLTCISHVNVHGNVSSNLTTFFTVYPNVKNPKISVLWFPILKNPGYATERITVLNTTSIVYLIHF